MNNEIKNALILHGTCDREEYFDEKYPSLSNSHWFPWLQKKLLCNGFLAQTPEMPNSYNPNYEEWKSTFKNFHNTNISLVIGHSAGAGFILKYLQENPLIILDKLILVAPWIDPNRKNNDFLQFQMKKLDNIKQIHIFYSMDDSSDIIKSVEKIQSVYGDGISYHKFIDKRHFTERSLKSKEFPELWEICRL